MRQQSRGKHVSLNLCEACDQSLKGDIHAHRLACAFTLFRDALLPRFGSTISLLSASHGTPLIGALQTCDSVEEVRELLESLAKTENIREPDVWARFSPLLKDVDLFEIVSEYATFWDFRKALRQRYMQLRGERGRAKHARFQDTREPRELLVLIHDTLHHLMNSRYPEDADRARLLLAETQLFIATHHGDPPAQEQSSPIAAHPPTARVA